MSRSPLERMRRLHSRGRHSRGLAVDRDGVALGPGLVLVRCTAAGYRCVSIDILTRVARTVFGADARLEMLPRLLAAMARALDAGDLVKAQLLGLEIPIGELDDAQLAKLAAATDLIKVGFDRSQPRDERGRWSREGNGSGAGETSDAASVQIADASEGVSDAGRIFPAPADDRAQARPAAGPPPATIPPPAHRAGNVGEYSPKEAAKLPPPPDGSKYLTLADGSAPWTGPFHALKGGPILVPKDVSVEGNVRAGEKILANYNEAAEADIREADGARFGTMVRLFAPGGEMDYQRTHSVGDHINRDYIDVGNYNYGAVMAAAGYSWSWTKRFAGLANLLGRGEKDWRDWFNNPRNIEIIRKGYDDYKAGRILPTNR